MQKLLSDYLLQKNYCSLPQIGTIQRKTLPANAVFGDQKIAPPVSTYELLDNQIANEDFVNFVALQNHISQYEAADKVRLMSQEIEQLKQQELFTIPFVGSFTKNENDALVFTNIKIPEIFTPQVYAERVIHPNDSHHILVGDTETSTSAMMEYYAVEEPLKKTSWWVWVLILLAMTIAGIVYYFFSDVHSAGFGNTNKLNFLTKDSTYRFVQ